MINLIPNEDKKEMSKNFYFRLISLAFVMLGVSLLVASIAILPAYFFSTTQKNFFSEKFTLQENEPIPSLDQDTLSIIKDLKSKLSLIENTRKNEFVFSQKIINEILLKKMNSIKITEIFYENEKEGGKKVNIAGLAPNREVLLLFRQTLEENPAFSKVDLPISNFVKGSNIRFNLTLTPS